MDTFNQNEHVNLDYHFTPSLKKKRSVSHIQNPFLQGAVSLSGNKNKRWSACTDVQLQVCMLETSAVYMDVEHCNLRRCAFVCMPDETLEARCVITQSPIFFWDKNVGKYVIWWWSDCIVFDFGEFKYTPISGKIYVFFETGVKIWNIYLLLSSLGATK